MKLESTLVKVGGSLYQRIPSEIVKHFNFKEGDNILTTIETLTNPIKNLAIKFKNENVKCHFGDKQVEGKIMEIDDENLTIFNSDKDTTFVIPLSIITSLSA